MRAATDPGVTKRASALLERERELEALANAAEHAAAHVGALLLIEGPAGIGKTRLLDEAKRLAGDREFLVRAARGGQLERQMPFGVARLLLEPVIERASEEERARLLAGSAELALTALGRRDSDTVGSAPDPLAPIHGLYWLTANLAEEKPVALLIDDVHWADSQTLRWIEYLARRLEDVAVLIVVAVRSGEPDEPAELEPLRLEAAILRPSPLSTGAMDEVIATELEARPAPEFSAVCARVTGGNPLLLAEVMRALRADVANPDRAAANSVAALGPGSIARYVLMRLGRFGSDAVRLAQSVAVLGGSPQLRHVAKLSELDEARAAGLCDRLRDAEILAPGQPIQFVHPLVRQAIYSDLSEEQRSHVHRQAATVLARTGAGAREIAPHLLACAPNGDQWVVTTLGEAAWEAARAGAFAAAASYLERALAEPPDDEVPVVFGLGRCLLQTNPARAKEILKDVAKRTSDPRMHIRGLRSAAQGYFVTGEWREAARCHLDVLESLPKERHEQRLVHEAELFFAEVGGIGVHAPSLKRIESVLAEASGDSAGACLVRQALAIGRFMAAAPIEEFIDLARSVPPHPWEIRATIPAATARCLGWSGYWDDARAEQRRIIESARGFGLMINQSYYTAVLAEIERHAGRLADSEADARTALEIAGDAATTFNPGLEARMNLIMTLIARGELAEAEGLASEVELSAGIEEAPISPRPLQLRAELHLARGNPEAAAEDFLVFGAGAERFGCLNPAMAQWHQQVAPALAALDRTPEAEQLISEAEERARRFGAPHVIATVLRSRGLIEPRKRGIETLRESVELLERSGPPHELARSLLELGAALRRDGQRSDSREPLQRALELAHRRGAGGTEAKAREELAAAGSRPRSVFRTGVASLTASELRTAKLAAEGLSNVEVAQRLFVTRKTVEKHLSNAYTKLEISGREELAGALEDPGELVDAT